MANKKPDKYQLICTAHGGKRPWYIVCNHVMKENSPIARITKASLTNVGDCLCDKCSKRVKELKVDDLNAVCDLCVERSIIPNRVILPGAYEEK